MDKTMREIKKVIKNTNEHNVDKVNWTNTWSKKYPVLKRYQEEVEIEYYHNKIQELLTKLEQDYQYNSLDAMLVLKDMLYQTWKNKK